MFNVMIIFPNLNDTITWMVVLAAVQADVLVGRLEHLDIHALA